MYNNSEMMIYTKIIRGGVLALMIICVFESSIWFRGIGFSVGRVFLLIGLLMFSYALYTAL